VLPEGWRATSVQIESGQAWLYQVQREDQPDLLYALKRLKNPGRASRFVREARAMQSLHANGVAVPDIVASDLEAERPWFAMPWYSDGSLEVAVNDRRFVRDPIKGLQTLQVLAGALSDVHAADVAHRDLKPANVLLDGEALALTDFGLCLEVEEGDAPGERLTETWEAVGSRYYIAPENEGGFNDALDQRPADFYAFGKVAWVLLAGRQPMPREHELEDPHRLETVADGRLKPIDLLLRDLLNRDPRGRLTDWGVVRDELGAVEASLGGRQRGTPRSVALDVLQAARRVRASDRITLELQEASAKQRREDWFRDLVEALIRRAGAVASALEPLQGELSGLVDIYPTSGGPASDEQLQRAGLTDLPGEPPHALPPGPAVAAVYLIHCPRGLSGLPTLTIRLWPIVGPEGVRFVRAPTLAAPGDQEVVPAFLIEPVFRLEGPFEAYRQSTVDAGIALVDESSRLFVALAEEYVRVVAEGADPALPGAWAERQLSPGDLSEQPGAVEAGADTTPPTLASLVLEPEGGTPPDDPTVTVVVRITDDQAGIGGGGSGSPSQARLRSPSGQMRDVLFIPATRVSGDELDAVYSQSFTLERHAERGLWRVESVLLVDNAGNMRSHDMADLASRGFSTSIVVR
jgi:Protein kinase domain